MPRRIVCVDLESSGRSLELHDVTEVAWWNLADGTRGEFIPWHNRSEVLAGAEIEALRMTGYLDRIADRVPRFPDDSLESVGQLHTALEGATLLGSNPRFDAGFMNKMFEQFSHNPHELWFDKDPWHYRLLDISAYAMGILHLDEMPSLDELCHLLEVDQPDHTAAGDVTSTVHCFGALRAMRSSLAPQAAA